MSREYMDVRKTERVRYLVQHKKYILYFQTSIRM